jgi:TolC family type I secretion outer membrane protein
MLRCRFTAFVVLTGLILSQRMACCSGLSSHPSALSLTQAIEIALREHPSLSASQSQLEIADQRIVQGRAGFLPRLNVSEGFQRTNNPPQAFSTKLNQQNFTPQDFAIDRLNQPNAVNDFVTNLTATWPLFDGGQAWHGWQQAKLGREAAERALERTRQQVIARTTAAYAAVLLARENLAVVESAMAAACAHLAAAESRYGSGLTVKSDLLQAQVRLADLEQQKLQVQSQFELAHSGLNAAMGVPDPVRFELSGRLDAAGEPEGTLESWLDTARDRRIELKELDLREAMARQEIEKARAGHLPNLELFGNYQIHTEDLDGSADSYSVGAVVNLNLFSGLAPSAKVAEAQAARREIQALRRQMESQVFLEVRQAYTQTASAFQRLAVAHRAVAQADEALRVVSNRYGGGLLTMVELLTAEASLQQARTAQARAQYDYTVGKAQLRLAAGVLEEK